MTWFVARWGGEVRGVRSARQSWSRRDGLLVALRDSGHVSFGEATPLPGFGLDTLEPIDADSLPAPVDDPDAVQRLACAIPSPSMRFAIETALLDRIARRRRQSLAQLLGASASTAPRSVLVGDLLDDQSLDAARTHAARGALTLKLKAHGRDLSEESRRLRELRQLLGPRVAVRLDLNGSLDAGAAREALELYATHGVELCEEPAGEGELLKLGAAATPWFADESATRPELFEAFLAHPGCGGFVLKPTLVGGLLPSLERARRAQAAGKRAVTSHAFEGPVALAAASELAVAIGAGPAHGLDRHAALAAFPQLDVPQLPELAPLVVVSSGGAGLGIHVEGPWDRP